MLDFPNAPTVGQQFIAPSGAVWTFDGVKWTAGAPSAAYLPLGGGTMTGGIILPATEPATAASAATRSYVDGNYSGFVNKFRNGTMDVWQRGTSISVPNTILYTADGWQVYVTGATASVSQGGAMGGELYSLAIVGAAGLTDCNLVQNMESFVVAPLAGQRVTFQALIYNNSGATITPQLYSTIPNATDNFGATTADLAAVNLQSIANGVTARVAYTFNVGGNCLRGYQVWLKFLGALNGAGKQVNIASLDIRVTPGWLVGLCANPPPPELRPVHEETVFCQRYYQTGVVGTLVSNAQSANSVGSTTLFPVVMRAAPTIAFGALTVNVNMTAPAHGDQITASGFRYYFNTTAAGSAQGSAPFTASAEL